MLMHMIRNPASVPKHVVTKPGSPTQRITKTPTIALRFLDLAELKARPAPVEMVAGLIREKSLVVMHGRAKSGKTYLVIDLLCATATGTSFLGNTVNSARAVYVCLEGIDEIPDRIRAWEARYKTVPKDRLLTDKGPLNLLDNKAVDGLIGALKDKQSDDDPIKLVVIDTLSRAMAGAEENSSTSMTATVRSCDRIRNEVGVAVVLVHHTPKGENSSTMRGHSALEGACSLGLYVSNSSGNRSALVQMNRSGPEGTSYNFTLEPQTFTREDSTPGDDLVVEFTGTSASNAGSSTPTKKTQVDLDADRLLMKLKGAMQKKDRQVSDDADGGTTLLRGHRDDLEEAKQEMKEDLKIDSEVDSDNARARTNKAVDKLKARGQLVMEGDSITVRIPPDDPADNEPPF